MSKMSELSYDIEQLYIDGLSAKSIAQVLDCPIVMVLAVLQDMGVEDVAETPQGEYYGA
jgi:hypothetical protein